MTISLHLEAANVQDLQRMCAELAHSGAPAPIVEAAATETPQHVKDFVRSADEKIMAEVKKPGRKPKSTDGNDKAATAEKPAEANTQTAVSPPAAEASAGASLSAGGATATTVAPSHEDMTAKLRELSASKGMPAVSAILKEFTAKDSAKKVERIKEVNPADYAAIIAKVDAALSQS